MGWDDSDSHVECNGAPFQKTPYAKYYTHGGEDYASVANPFSHHSIIYGYSLVAGIPLG